MKVVVMNGWVGPRVDVVCEAGIYAASLIHLSHRTFELGADVGHLLVDSFFLEFADTTYCNV